MSACVRFSDGQIFYNAIVESKMWATESPTRKTLSLYDTTVIYESQSSIRVRKHTNRESDDLM